MYKNKRILSLIFFVVLPLLLIFTYLIKTLVSGFNWPSIESKVVFSQIEKGEEGGKYSVNIVYEFDVDGNSYRGGNLKLSKFDRETAQSIVNNYPVGKKIVAYYNPDYLYESTSEIENKYQSFSPLRIIAVFAYLYGFIRSFLARTLVAVLIIYALGVLTGKIAKTKPSFYISLIGAISVSSITTALLLLEFENLNLTIFSFIFSVPALFLVLNKIGLIPVRQSAFISIAYGVVDDVFYYGAILLFYMLIGSAFL